MQGDHAVSGKRRSYESGHRPKFMVVVDKTPECFRAVHFASRRAARTGASMIMLAVVDPPDNFEWIGVGEAMVEEAREAAEALLEEAAREARSAAGVEPEQVIFVGTRADEIIKLINEDEDISFLVLAAGTGKEGPGPLVSTLAGKAASTFPVPIVIVPGGLTDEEIDALAG
jgi:nucleotide-binding universal stress UspA family protein